MHPTLRDICISIDMMDMMLVLMMLMVHDETTHQS
jgi:hypothetical protein